jgi:hypothetical protein
MGADVDVRHAYVAGPGNRPPSRKEVTFSPERLSLPDDHCASEKHCLKLGSQKFGTLKTYRSSGSPVIQDRSVFSTELAVILPFDPSSKNAGEPYQITKSVEIVTRNFRF